MVCTLYHKVLDRQPGDRKIPYLKLHGMCMCAAGIEAGTQLQVEVRPGAIALRVNEKAVLTLVRTRMSPDNAQIKVALHVISHRSFATTLGASSSFWPTGLKPTRLTFGHGYCQM
ncbi:hypothetical protein [Stenotrophomonas sp. PS02300]|uniref:hypothetical protein n=1 Tax=Stenotrophomonas sp. PS02300 TaxID=2991426 RepID=UPI00249B952F|nr:hypothetical protein [Stenotrophomonas sp. PS02300]